jgi:hypothetical protein
MRIERFIWTTHAEDRRIQRLLDRSEMERAVRSGHADRRINAGEADWRIDGLLADGRHFAVVYNHPNGNDDAAVVILSVWDY